MKTIPLTDNQKLCIKNTKSSKRTMINCLRNITSFNNVTHIRARKLRKNKIRCLKVFNQII